MKTLGPLTGAVVLRAPAEEVLPVQRVPIPVLVQSLLDRYGFMRIGEITINTPIVFENGKADIGGKQTPFTQLQLLTAGTVVFSTSTDEAESIMDDIVSFAEREHGYRFSQASTRRLYLSTVVVEFEKGLNNVLSSLFLLEKAICNEVPERILKRLSFGLIEHDVGMGAPAPPAFATESIERSDFVIERRLGSDPEANRYFSAAPLKTADHLALLEKIEKISIDDFKDR